MSPVASETPFADDPPGVVESIAWPNSWPMTSSEETHWPTLLWPTATKDPFQNALLSLRPMRIAKPPPEPLMPLRPSQLESMSHSRWTSHSASTHPVSRFVPIPLPHTSSVPVRTRLLRNLRHEIPGRVGSAILKILPLWAVLMVSGVGPLIHPVPEPSLTSSWLASTAPFAASTNTCSRL